MGARREIVAAVAERYRSGKRREKGRILDELCATTGWRRKHALRALAGGMFGTVRCDQDMAEYQGPWFSVEPGFNGIPGACLVFFASRSLIFRSSQSRPI